MAPNNQQQQAAAAAAAAAVHLPDFHADSPQCWFDNLDSRFATANITLSITKFHWAMAKLPFSLTPTIRPLTRDPTAVADPYKKLKDLILESYIYLFSARSLGIFHKIFFYTVLRYNTTSRYQKVPNRPHITMIKTYA
jgi:hypothetical protein